MRPPRKPLLLLCAVLLQNIQPSASFLVLCNLDSSGKICTLRNIRPDSVMLNNFAGVSSLVFVQAQTQKIPQTVIDKFPPLDKLDLSKNSFTELTFDDTTATLTNLGILDASSNNITTLAANVFAKTPNLKELYLSRNQIASLPSTVFFQLSKLTLLDLSRNQIKTIAQDNFFGFLRNLRFIYLNHNGITKLRTSFGNVTNLVEFDGSHNDLKDWSLTFASGSTVKLNLAYCGLKNSYSSAADKEELDLEGNMIEIMKITGKVTRLRANNNIIRQVEIDPSIKLEALELANNFISDITNITKVENLQVLDLSGNRLKNVIKGDIFSDLTALTYLSLKNTGATITPELLKENTRLMYLDLTGNRIGNFDFKTLKFLTNLEILRLDSNEMAEIIGYEDVKELLPELNTIGLSNNMFSCSYLQKLLMTFKEALVDVSVPMSNLEFIFPNMRGVKCIKDMANVTEQLVSVDNIINMQDEGFKEDIRKKLQTLQDDTSSQKQALTGHDQQLQEISGKIKDSIKDLLTNTNSKFTDLSNSAGQNKEVIDKLKDLQDNLGKLNQLTDQKLDKISGNLESPKMDKLVTDTQVDIDGLKSTTKAAVVISALLLVAVVAVLAMLLREKMKGRFTSTRSYSEQQLTL